MKTASRAGPWTAPWAPMTTCCCRSSWPRTPSGGPSMLAVAGGSQWPRCAPPPHWDTWGAWRCCWSTVLRWETGTCGGARIPYIFVSTDDHAILEVSPLWCHKRSWIQYSPKEDPEHISAVPVFVFFQHLWQQSINFKLKVNVCCCSL